MNLEKRFRRFFEDTRHSPFTKTNFCSRIREYLRHCRILIEATSHRRDRVESNKIPALDRNSFAPGKTSLRETRDTVFFYLFFNDKFPRAAGKTGGNGEKKKKTEQRLYTLYPIDKTRTTFQRPRDNSRDEYVSPSTMFLHPGAHAGHKATSKTLLESATTDYYHYHCYYLCLLKEHLVESGRFLSSV